MKVSFALTIYNVISINYQIPNYLKSVNPILLFMLLIHSIQPFTQQLP